MTDKLPLAIVGCGGMGGRHLLGLKELHDSSMCNVELVAVCDLRRDNADYLADNAERLLGKRPLVFEDMAEMVRQVSDLQAVDITTEAFVHHTVACAAFELGLNVQCEKPLALTLRGINRVLAAQRRAGKVLSVAENFRRDPLSRLTRALVESGAIGSPYLALEISASAGNRIVITPWRHIKTKGGNLLDGGVHNADMMLYTLGDVTQVYAQTKLWEKTRYKTQGGGGSVVSGFYAHWEREMPEAIEATAEDTLVSVLSFASGVVGQWTQSYAAHGPGFGRREVFGSEGSLILAGIRNGITPILQRDGREPISGEALLDFVPDFHLDAITSELFGADRLTSYAPGFPAADRKLLAIEYHELAECIATGKQPEVDGLVGRRAVALCYAAFESSVLNRPVTLDEVEAEQVDAYQAEINQELGL